MRRKPTVHLVFSVQEEFNLRGALPAAQALAPDIAIQLDLMLATDTPDMAARGDVRLGGGPAMSLYSFHGRGTLNGTIPHPALVRLFDDDGRGGKAAAAAERPYRRAHRLLLCAVHRRRRRRHRPRLPLPLHAFLARGLRSRRPRRPDAAARRGARRGSTGKLQPRPRRLHPMKHYLGIDIGTFESKGVLVDDDGAILATASKPHKMLVPQAGLGRAPPARGLVGRLHLHHAQAARRQQGRARRHRRRRRQRHRPLHAAGRLATASR